jgi:hypothetical protein
VPVRVGGGAGAAAGLGAHLVHGLYRGFLIQRAVLTLISGAG